MIDPDRAIVDQVKAGDTGAYRTLVDRHKGRVFGVLMSLVGDESLAEELAQDTFVKAYTGLDGFRGNATFATWLVQIAIHGARDYRRRIQRLRKRRVVSLDALREAKREGLEPPDPSRGADPAGQVEADEEHDLIRRALAQLPPEYREVIVLKHIEGWSYEDIAATCGDTEGTLKVRAHRARRLMREILMGFERNPRTDPAPSDGKERENG